MCKGLFYYLPPPAHFHFHFHFHCFVQQRHCSVCDISLNIYPYKIRYFVDLCIFNLYIRIMLKVSIFVIIQFKIWVAICKPNWFVFSCWKLIPHFTFLLSLCWIFQLLLVLCCYKYHCSDTVQCKIHFYFWTSEVVSPIIRVRPLGHFIHDFSKHWKICFSGGNTPSTSF